MNPFASSHQEHDQHSREHNVEGCHRVVRPAVIEEGERCDQERVVGRMEIWQDYELIRRMRDYLQLVLLLQRKVIDRRPALQNVQLGP